MSAGVVSARTGALKVPGHVRPADTMPAALAAERPAFPKLNVLIATQEGSRLTSVKMPPDALSAWVGHEVATYAAGGCRYGGCCCCSCCWMMLVFLLLLASAALPLLLLLLAAAAVLPQKQQMSR